MKYVILIIIILLATYSWLWFKSQKNYPVEYGISFNQNHARDLGLDWKEVYTAMLTELKPKYIRIAAMWNEVEKNKGEYDFANVDYMMDKARELDSKVGLQRVVGGNTRGNNGTEDHEDNDRCPCRP
mgnify:CR=1 FL=1